MHQRRHQPSLQTIIGKMLKRKRESLKGQNGLPLTQIEFSRRHCVKKQTYNLWETDFPLKNMLHLEDILGMKMSEILRKIADELDKQDRS